MILTLIKKNLCNPWALVFLLLAIGVGYVQVTQQAYQNGYQAAEFEHLKIKAAAVARAIKETNRINAENEAIAQAYWQQQIEQKPKVHTIEKRITEYVTEYVKSPAAGRCDLDDDELRILQDLTHLANGTRADKTDHRTSLASEMPPAANAH